MKLEVLIDIIDELFNNLHIPIMILDERLNLIYPKITMINIHDLLDGILFISPDKIKILVTDHMAAYGCFPFQMNQQTHYIISCCLLNDIENVNQEVPERWKDILPEDVIKTHINSYHLINYQNIIKMIYEIVEHRVPEQNQLIVEFLNTQTQKKITNDVLTMRRLTQNTPDYYRWELLFFESFIKGNFNEIKSLLRQMTSYDVVPLSDDLLQEQIYKFISFITLLTRTTIQEGASTELAFSLSDSYIKKLNQVHNSDSIHNMIEQAIYDFYQLLIESKKSYYSLNIYKCLHYIDTHLYDKVSLQDLIEYTGLSASYLSVTFKKEVGETVTSYIQRKKIEESTRLLLFTSKSYIDISNTLQFSSQSNFIQIFKKYKEMTPKQYQLYHLKAK